MSAMVQIFSSFTEWKYVPLHKWENIHYLFYITCTKIQILKQISIKKVLKTILAQAKHFTSGTSNSTWEVLLGRLRHAKRTYCACCICRHVEFRTYSFLFLKHCS